MVSLVHMWMRGQWSVLSMCGWRDSGQSCPRVAGGEWSALYVVAPEDDSQRQVKHSFTVQSQANAKEGGLTGRLVTKTYMHTCIHACACIHAYACTYTYTHALSLLISYSKTHAQRK